MAQKTTIVSDHSGVLFFCYKWQCKYVYQISDHINKYRGFPTNSHN